MTQPKFSQFILIDVWFSLIKCTIKFYKNFLRICGIVEFFKCSFDWLFFPPKVNIMPIQSVVGWYILFIHTVCNFPVWLCKFVMCTICPHWRKSVLWTSSILWTFIESFIRWVMIYIETFFGKKISPFHGLFNDVFLFLCIIFETLS